MVFSTARYHKLVETLYSFNPTTNPSHNRALRWLNLAALFLVIIYVILQIISSVGKHSTTISPAHNQQIKTQPQLTYNVKEIIDAALFSVALQKPLSEITLPKTQLQLILRGAFTANDPAKASAIIEDSNKKNKHYKVGNKIFGETTLKAVYNDRVVLANNGKLETLYFPVNNNKQNPVNTANVSGPENTGNNVSADQKRQQLIKQRLQELRDRAKRQRS